MRCTPYVSHGSHSAVLALSYSMAIICASMHRIRHVPYRIAILILSVAACFTVLCFTPPPSGHAVSQQSTGIMKAVDHEHFIPANPIAIQNIDNWEDPQLVDSSSSPTVSVATAPVDNESCTLARGSSGVAFAPFLKEYADAPEYRQTHVHADMFNNPLAQKDANKLGWGALILEFPNLTTVGAHGWATVRYPFVGTYKDRPIGADVTYTVYYAPQWQPEDLEKHRHAHNKSLAGGENDPQAIHEAHLEHPESNSYPVIQCAKSLYSGVMQYNCNHLDTSIAFFDKETKQPLNVTGAFYTIGSLTGSEGVSALSFSEMWYPRDGYTHHENGYVHGDSEMTSADGVDGLPGIFTDRVDADTFWKRSATILPNSLCAFTTWPSTRCRDTQQYGDPQWWSLSSAAMAPQKPTAPSKHVDREQALPGDSLTYQISQPLGTVGSSLFGTYRSMRMTDNIPAELDAEHASMSVSKVEDGKVHALPDTAGAYAIEEQQITYTFAPEFLAQNPPHGELYTWNITAKIKEAPMTKRIDNTASVTINDEEQSTNTVTTLVDATTLNLTKETKPMHSEGERVPYRITVSNPNQGTIAQDVTITDLGLPLGSMPIDTSSITLTGLADTAKSTHTVDTKDNKIEICISCLPYNHPVTISYDVLAQPLPAAQSDDTKSDTIKQPLTFINTVTATCKNRMTEFKEASAQAHTQRITREIVPPDTAGTNSNSTVPNEPEKNKGSSYDQTGVKQRSSTGSLFLLIAGVVIVLFCIIYYVIRKHRRASTAYHRYRELH